MACSSVWQEVGGQAEDLGVRWCSLTQCSPQRLQGCVNSCGFCLFVNETWASGEMLQAHVKGDTSVAHEPRATGPLPGTVQLSEGQTEPSRRVAEPPACFSPPHTLQHLVPFCSLNLPGWLCLGAFAQVAGHPSGLCPVSPPGLSSLSTQLRSPPSSSLPLVAQRLRE